MPGAVDDAVVLVVLQVVPHLLRPASEDAPHLEPLDEVLIPEDHPLHLALLLVPLHPLPQLEALGNFSEQVPLLLLVVLVVEQPLEALNGPLDDALVALASGVDHGLVGRVVELDLVDLAAVGGEGLTYHAWLFALEGG